MKGRSVVLDLKDDNQLKAACENAIQHSLALQGNQNWVSDLITLIVRVRDVGHAEFMTEKFQRTLWDSSAVASTGMGNVDTSSVAKNPVIAEHLWQLKTQYAAVDRVQQDILIADTWRLVASEVALVSKRTPRLKMYRLFAVLCPGAFTTIAHTRKLRELAKVMGVRLQGEARQALHRLVLDRILKKVLDG
jgi:5-methylcytosine-specific restriction protein B